MEKNRVKEIAFVGMYLALYFVLDYIAHVIPFLRMPSGGSLGLGTIALLLCAYHLGIRDGIIVSLLTIPISFMTSQIWLVQNEDGFALWQILIQFIMEYPLAYGLYGIAPIFPNIKKVYTGVIVVNLIRLALHTIAGTVYWGSPWVASFSYNASYMIPTMILGLILMPIIVPRLQASGLSFNKKNI